MKKIVSKAALGLLVSGAVVTAFAGGPDMPAPMMTPGFYLGFGGSWNTVDVDSKVTVSHAESSTVTNTSTDVENSSTSRLAPMAQVGYWAPVDSQWLWGLQANYKYLNARTEDPLTNAGELFANIGAGTGVEVLKTRVTHELLLLAYMGMQFHKSFVYLGAGGSMFRVQQRVKAATQETPSTGNVYSDRVAQHTDTVWGGAAQMGVNWYFNPAFFMNLSYTYAVTGTNAILSDVRDANKWNGSISSTADVTTKGSGFMHVQEVMFSVNKVFAM